MTVLRLVLLGDSLAYGSGATHVDDTLGPRLARVLEGAGYDVDLHVLAVPGAVSQDLGGQVRRAVPLAADLAVVLVGANDLARLVPAVRAAAALGGAVGELRAAGSDVLVVPAPDMSMVPFVPPAYRSLVRTASEQLQREQAAAARAVGAMVAEVSAGVAAAFSADVSLFSADRFHPSSAGYGHIADALTPHVLAAAAARRESAA